MGRLLSREARFYVVQRGDTLSQIGEKVGIGWRKLVSLNRLRNPDVIQPGQLLQLED